MWDYSHLGHASGNPFWDVVFRDLGSKALGFGGVRLRTQS